ncbi:MAG TPA: YvcK family protein, partial [Candidatus Omnitrophota bacterium]|nr:YvcK family protein [Candidatus Omnitrophota bacterium]
KVLAIRGKVYPATLETVKLVARRENGVEVEGECRIRDEKGSPIERLSLNPANCKATEESVEAIKEADVIIMGPGSLYTSVMPNLLIEGIQNAIARSRARKIYICNVMTESGETDDFSVSDHVKTIVKHTRPGIVNCCVANVSRIPESLYDRYKAQGQYPVKLDKMDEKWLNDEKIELVKAHISGSKEFVRHDPEKLTEVIMDVIEK